MNPDQRSTTDSRKPGAGPSIPVYGTPPSGSNGSATDTKPANGSTGEHHVPANFKRRELVDRAAAVFVKIGGLGIIASILGILLFIVFEVYPLLSGADVKLHGSLKLPAGREGVMLSDEYNTLVAMLGRNDGVIRIFDAETGEMKAEHPLELPPVALVGEPPSGKDAAVRPPQPSITGVMTIPGTYNYAAATSDGRVIIQPVDFDVTFDGSTRHVDASFPSPVVLTLDENHQPITVYSAFMAKSGHATAAAQLSDGTIAIGLRSIEEGGLGGEGEETLTTFKTASPFKLTSILIDVEQRNLYGGTAEGQLIYWRLADGEPADPVATSAGPSSITALSMLIGGRSIVVGQANGDVSVWFKVRPNENEENFALTRIRDFPKHPGAIREIAPSMRDRGFLVLDETGKLSLHFSTSERTLWEGETAAKNATGLYFAPKAKYAMISEPGNLLSYDIQNPHPDISWNALFGKTWYEGYPAPSYTWQSTGGTDDFESKFGLVPLIIGTLKGTFYSLILAIPLAVLGAMFASQFMHPSLKAYVKPVVETMASLPSVVLGFIGGLWLAPLLQKVFPGFVLMFLVLPLLVVAMSRVWLSFPRAFRNRFPTGIEAILLVGVLLAGIWTCIAASPLVERLVFGGNFQAWLNSTLGIRYDQRNAIVVGLAMGFAVIPIIFAISEDAFSNVPRHLTSASLALGASRWQTVTQIVLPTASPGIFSAIMIGFGRAVGETMIVLMATGNTPIMDWDIFNGFRTLSANIAVEIPEAPVHGSLYRLLFLAALMLFTLTFVVNTFAEMVRHRLRDRYSKL